MLRKAGRNRRKTLILSRRHLLCDLWPVMFSYSFLSFSFQWPSKSSLEKASSSPSTNALPPFFNHHRSFDQHEKKKVKRGKYRRNKKNQKKKTSRTEFGQQMRSGDLLAYLSLNHLLNGVLSCSRCYFVRISPFLIVLGSTVFKNG